MAIYFSLNILKIRCYYRDKANVHVQSKQSCSLRWLFPVLSYVYFSMLFLLKHFASVLFIFCQNILADKMNKERNQKRGHHGFIHGSKFV